MNSKELKFIRTLQMIYLSAVAIFLFSAIADASQQIELSQNSSRFGGHFLETVYSAGFVPHTINLKYTKETLGKKYFANYHYEFNEYFIFSTYNLDEIINIDNFDLGVGYGWYLWDIFGTSEKLSIAGIWRAGQYITSIRLRSIVKAEIWTFKNVYFYRPEVQETSSDSDLSIKISEKTSIGYKRSVVSSFGRVNYTDRVYGKVVW